MIIDKISIHLATSTALHSRLAALVMIVLVSQVKWVLQSLLTRLIDEEHQLADLRAEMLRLRDFDGSLEATWDCK